MAIKIIINGAYGRMGTEAVKAIEADNELKLIAAIGKQDNLAATIRKTKADVVVDLTTAESAFENTVTIIDENVHPVIGTSGLLPKQVTKLKQICQEKQLGGLIAPNFSIGAVLMMHFAAIAAKYLPQAEIIELHHDGKLDSPSGTAVKTADLMAQARTQAPKPSQEEKQIIPGARGALQEDIHIHAVRLPGLVAHQEVLFGGHFETLSIRHDSMHRQSFMPGIILSCKKVVTMKELVYGLEKILIG